ncbi:MAG: hypothetical protein KatS3mg026_1111 [Bacteroidia bacterium]|nr:MAG: hypothetical protein KatS3mg026_1111 [Bacteroidia bacterium]
MSGLEGRDPWGSVLQVEGKWYRYFTPEGERFYRESLPLQTRLAEQGLWLWAGEPAGGRVELPPLACLTYPWEWDWLGWQEAALSTLRIQKEALKAGWILRDATSLNLTRHEGHMVWFDQLSLAPYQAGEPWKAYPEFVATFLAPLLLMAWRDRRLGKELLLYPQGLPLDLVYTLLPSLRKWHPTALIHLRLTRQAPSTGARPNKKESSHPTLSPQRLFALIESLEVDIQGLSPQYARSPWEGYQDVACPYSERARAYKQQTVATWLERLAPRRGMDLGAHVGTYTQLLLRVAKEKVLALEQDAQAIDQLASSLADARLYPIWADIAHPSPPVQIGGRTLPGLLERLESSVEVVLALALVHHLRLRSFLSFSVQAHRFAHFLEPGGYLLVEYVPPTDPMVRQLHSSPESFPDYSEEGFLAAMGTYFSLEAVEHLPESERSLYLFRKQ